LRLPHHGDVDEGKRIRTSLAAERIARPARANLCLERMREQSALGVPVSFLNRQTKATSRCVPSHGGRLIT
jgi:hypothetical protein